MFGELLNKYVYLYLQIIEAIVMIATNYSEFRINMKKFLDEVETTNETLVIKRGTGKGSVMISLTEYNSLMETVHLLSSKKNADRLYESIQQMREGKTVEKSLIED